MRILTLLCFITISISSLCQSPCTSSYKLFAFPQKGKPQEIHSLGHSPQFDFLRGITESDKFLSALKSERNRQKYKKDFAELNRILQEIGFSNGIDDAALTNKSLSYEDIPYGTIGNLGYNSQNYVYSILLPFNGSGVPGWKITSPSGCTVYVFTKCGNAFYPRENEDCCQSLTIDSKEQSLDILCKNEKTKKKLKMEVWGYYIKRSKQKIKGQSQQQEQSQTVYLGESEIEYESYAPINNKTTVTLASYNTTEKTCDEKTLVLPLTLKQTTTDLSVPQTTEEESKRVLVEISKKVYKKAIRKSRNSPQSQ